MDQSLPFPPSPSPACCVTGLWSCHDRLSKQDTKKRKNKKHTPAYTKVNKVIIKKISLGSRHYFTRAPLAPAPGRPVRSREGESLRGGKDGPHVPAGLRDRSPGTGWCSPRRRCSAAGSALWPPRLLPGWVRGQESAPDFLHTSLLGKWTRRRCASPSMKEGGGDGGESHPLP